MKTYEVTITETLKMKVQVEASDAHSAEALVSEKWRNSAYILDADNFVGVDFTTKEKKRSREQER